MNHRWLPLALGAALAVGALACDDRLSAATTTCERSADCPGGQRCVERLCVDQRQCDAGLGCCALETCQGGVCAPAPTDDCAAGCPDPDFECRGDYCVRRRCADDDGCEGGRCLGGFCVRGLPCDGLCGPDDACFPHRDLCRPAPPQCAMTCAAGEVAVVLDAEAQDGPVCALDAAECACVGPPAVDAGDLRDADMALLRGAPVFVAYDPDLGDVVVVEDVESDRPRVTFVDGLPDDAAPRGEDGRGADLGPDRGRYPRVAIDARNRLHLAYYDLDARALRYVRREADGRWNPPVIVDAEGDAGRDVRLALDPAGRPHLVYSVVETADGRSGLRYAVAAGPDPAAGDFRVVALSMRFGADGETAPPGVLPARYGVRPCFRLAPDGAAVVAFHDGVERRLLLARGTADDGFDVHPLDGRMALAPGDDPGGRYADVLEHAAGEWCDLVAGEAGVQLVFTDERTWSLLAYRGAVAGGGSIEVVDPGGLGRRRRVGPSPALDLDPQARAVVVYQDASDNTLRLGVRTAGGWSSPPLIVDADGPTGFANRLFVRDGVAIIGTLSLSGRAGGRVAARLRVLRVPLP